MRIRTNLQEETGALQVCKAITTTLLAEVMSGNIAEIKLASKHIYFESILNVEAKNFIPYNNIAQQLA